jgi:predicted CxxxxCH...CXXCH cytochrome family protein
MSKYEREQKQFDENFNRAKYKKTKTGLTFYVDSTLSGASSWSGRRFSASFATIQQALDTAVASRGDTILVSPFHTETVATSMVMSKIGVSVIGLSHNGLKPVITGNGTIDVFDVTAASCSIENLEFAAPATDAQTSDINVQAAKCLIKDTKHHGSTTALNKVDIITLEAAADDCIIDGVRIYNDTVECVGGIVLEGACSRVEIKNCLVFDTVGWTNGAISDEATATEVYCHHNTFKNAKAATVVMEWGNNSTGICAHNQISGRHTTIASNVTTGTGMDFYQNLVTEEASLNGILIPVADAD